MLGHHQFERLRAIMCVAWLAAFAGCQALTTRPASPGVAAAGGNPGTEVLAAQAPGAPVAPACAACSQQPNEHLKVSLPAYRVEPPDILLIDVVKLVPKAPYHIGPQDVLRIASPGVLPDQFANPGVPGYNPLNPPPPGMEYTVEPSGNVDLGPAFGKVHVAGLSLEEATSAVERQLGRSAPQPKASIYLVEAAGQQQVAGEHLVGPDGRVNLGTYGCVFVSGMTIDEVRQTIERHLSQFLDRPRVAVDIQSYNSKVYYVITEGAGAGDSLLRFPVTGNETVIDALSQVNGLSRVVNKNRIWIARPTPSGSCCEQILPVHWDDITMRGEVATNYQILPGDRVFIAQDQFYAADSLLGKLISPLNTLFGVATLGSQTVFRIQHPESSL